MNKVIPLVVAWMVLGIGASTAAKPNIILFFLDDSGWSDFQPFGDPAYKTPNVEKLAEEGCRFNHFMVSQAICSASRAALLSGCYPGRTKVFGAHGPNAEGLSRRFATMGEVLKAHGYKTAVFGKWHIGDQTATRPPARGFDESAGLMYSNDMWKHHPVNPKHWGKFPLKYWRNGEVLCEEVTPEFQKSLTSRATKRSVDFIQRNKENSFFLYVPYSMPHVPLYCSDQFKGKSGAGLYGDVIVEIDDSIGQILNAIKQAGVEKNTLIIFTSDNGPWTKYGNHAGSTPYRAMKATSFEGGIRSACVIKYPKEIKAGAVSNSLFCSIDLMPTLCHVTGARLPENAIDGKNVWQIITGQDGAKTPHTYYPISTGKKLEGIVSADGRWKLHLPHSYARLAKAGADGQGGEYEFKKIELSLFDLKNDPHESKNVIQAHPEIADRLKRLAARHNKKFYTR